MMPRKGYRSLTLPEDVYLKLVSAGAKYGTSSQKLIEALLIDDNKVGVFDETFNKKFLQGKRILPRYHENDGKCTVQIEHLGRFREWIKERRGTCDDTVDRYMAILEGSNPSVKPEDFIQYGRWRTVAFRNYIQFRYQMGLMTAEERTRWMDLLRIRPNAPKEPPEVKEADVRRMMVDPHENIVDVLYYSGIRITEACYLGGNNVPYEELDGFRRYAVGWTRGNKRCDYAYLPLFIEPKPYKPDWTYIYVKLPMRLKVLRKFFYRTAKRTALENRADPLIADFYQSRVSKFSIGERHYGELRTEADSLYPKVMESLGSIAGRG